MECSDSNIAYKKKKKEHGYFAKLKDRPLILKRF